MDFSTIAGDFERLLADLYPYRVPLTLAGIASLFALAWLAVRVGLLNVIRRYRMAVGVAAVPALALAIVAGNYLLSPLWERTYLEESSPLAMTMEPPAGDGAPMMTTGANEPAMARLTHSGDFHGADDFHFGRGKVLLIRDGEDLTLRFEDFSVRNGPDLYVYFSRDEKPTRVDENLNLGRLKATDGAFNYEVPDDVNLSTARSVIVWCRQFGVLFATAVLTPA